MTGYDTDQELHTISNFPDRIADRGVYMIALADALTDEQRDNFDLESLDLSL
jgi:hypothetical protein